MWIMLEVIAAAHHLNGRLTHQVRCAREARGLTPHPSERTEIRAAQGSAAGARGKATERKAYVTVAERHDTSGDSKSCRKGESRACIMHIWGGIAMLAAGLALLIIT